MWDAGKENGHSFPLLFSPLSPPVSRESAFRCAVTITISRRAAARSAPFSVLVEDRESLCFPRSESLSDISIAKARRTFRLSRDLHVPLIYPRLFGFSPQDAISFVEVMRWLNRECRFSVLLKFIWIYDSRFYF